jgi:hypothetical protein
MARLTPLFGRLSLRETARWSETESEGGRGWDEKKHASTMRFSSNHGAPFAVFCFSFGRPTGEPRRRSQIARIPSKRLVLSGFASGAVSHKLHLAHAPVARLPPCPQNEEPFSPGRIPFLRPSCAARRPRKALPSRQTNQTSSIGSRRTVRDSPCRRPSPLAR